MESFRAQPGRPAQPLAACDCGLPCSWWPVLGKLASGWSFVSDKPPNRLVWGLGIDARGEVGD